MKSTANLLKISLLLALLPASASAGSVSNLQLTTTSISLDFTGNLPASAPSNGTNYIHITNPSMNANPGFMLEQYQFPSSASFSGSQELLFGGSSTGGHSFGDYLSFRFTNSLTEGSNFSGTLTGGWSSTVFDPNAVSELDVYWGKETSNNYTSGSLLGTAAVNDTPAVSFSNLQLTTTSISLDFTGSLPSAPSNGANYIYLTNPSMNANPGFMLEQYQFPSSASFSGSQELLFGGSSTGGHSFGDYLAFRFTNSLTQGSDFTGTLTSSWSSTVFDPNAVSELNVYWGYETSNNYTSGSLLGSASSAVPDTGSTSAVPDAGSTAALLGAGVVALAFARRRLG